MSNTTGHYEVFNPADSRFNDRFPFVAGDDASEQAAFDAAMEQAEKWKSPDFGKFIDGDPVEIISL